MQIALSFYAFTRFIFLRRRHNVTGTDASRMSNYAYWVKGTYTS